MLEAMIIGFSAAIPAIGLAAVITWWLSKQFDAVKTYFDAAIDKHELVDQQRHSDNLKAANKLNISVALLEQSVSSLEHRRHNGRS